MGILATLINKVFGRKTEDPGASQATITETVAIETASA